MKSINNLPENIYDLLTSNWIPSSDSVGNFCSSLSIKIAESRQPQRRGLRLSKLGSSCSRELWYYNNTPEFAEPFSGPVQLKFLYGHIIEELVLWLAAEAGYDVTDQQKEVELHGIKGRMDGRINKHLVDVKSASTLSMDKFRKHLNPDTDSFGYIDQLLGYCEADNEEEGYFIAIDKTLGHIVVDKHKRSGVSYKSKVEEQKRIIALPEPPPIPAEMADVEDGKSGNMKLCTKCSYCSFKFKCRDNIRTFLYSNGPRYLTKVERLPDVYELKNGEAKEVEAGAA